MRLLLAVVALLGSVALLIFGGVSALVGYAEQHSADQTYSGSSRPAQIAVRESCS
jgi:hypothetical protein